MAAIPNHHKFTSLAILLNRLALGLYFTLAGLHKINGGIEQFVHGPFAAFTPGWVPGWVATPVGYALPFVELCTGVLMMAGLYAGTVAVVMAATLACFTAALVISGKFFSLPGPMHPNVLLITIALLLSALGPGKLSLDAWLRRVG